MAVRAPRATTAGLSEVFEMRRRNKQDAGRTAVLLSGQRICVHCDVLPR